MPMLNQITSKTKCDVRDCKNDATYFIATKGLLGRCYVCAKCLEELCAQGRTVTTPKSPKNAIKKQMERKLEEQNHVKE